MSDLFVKPGNRQRGWNDPPQFSYGLQQQQQRQRRPALSGGLALPRGPSRRSGAAVAAGEGKEPGAVPGAPVASGPAGVLVPPSVDLPPPPPPPPPPPAGPPTAFQRAAAPAPSVAETGKECEVEDVLPSLQETLDDCRRFVQKQVCEDIHKRLVILQDMWTQGKLSSPVRKRMGVLTEELKSQHWDEADEIHRSLMVDHVAEVSQWMVGVKRLIAEAKNLPGGDPLP